MPNQYTPDFIECDTKSKIYFDIKQSQLRSEISKYSDANEEILTMFPDGVEENAPTYTIITAIRSDRRKVTDYDIIEADSKQKLVEIMRQKIKRGSIPVGGMILDNSEDTTKYLQTIFKK